MMRPLILAGLLAVAFAAPALAQAPAVPASDLMLSWRSNALSPEGYAGRVAAPPGGSVLLLAEALVNGRPTDLRGYEVRWFINDDLYQSGPGLFSTTYRVPEFSDDLIDVRVQIIGAPFAATEASMTVPFTEPTVVIEAAGGSALRSGKNYFYATPYSFNAASASDVTYTWTVDGFVPAADGDPRELSVTVDGTPDRRINIGLVATNPLNQEERADSELVLIPAR